MSNKEEIKELMQSSYEEAKDRIKKCEKWDKIKRALDCTDWDNEEKRKHLIAARYLSSIVKGENALELCMALEENYYLEDGNKKKTFNVPPYIHNALEWLLK